MQLSDHLGGCYVGVGSSGRPGEKSGTTVVRNMAPTLPRAPPWIDILAIPRAAPSALPKQRRNTSLCRRPPAVCQVLLLLHCVCLAMPCHHQPEKCTYASEWDALRLSVNGHAPGNLGSHTPGVAHTCERVCSGHGIGHSPSTSLATKTSSGAAMSASVCRAMQNALNFARIRAKTVVFFAKMPFMVRTLMRA